MESFAFKILTTALPNLMFDAVSATIPLTVYKFWAWAEIVKKMKMKKKNALTFRLIFDIYFVLID
ncbi:hypothetical protein ADIARSV_1511 [Arcticibacter svalbardensis MN12-7]|uniref:Uncharacterized protein n=1 Tax=Arcticibacter svalbardensis MN12-7 TaxID=1150600 RepID=R9GUB9_9SPHI|nr:hypothetical protein ADIARSV_1511 [Arcticibacter svalbardensis MN12-7]